MNNLVTKSTTEGQAAFMLYNVTMSGIRSTLPLTVIGLHDVGLLSLKISWEYRKIGIWFLIFYCSFPYLKNLSF